MFFFVRAVKLCDYTAILFYLSGLRSYDDHPCIALLYCIPMGIFDCVVDGETSAAIYLGNIVPHIYGNL